MIQMIRCFIRVECRLDQLFLVLLLSTILMQAPAVAHEFMALVEKSGLLNPRQIRAVTNKLGLEGLAARTVARELILNRILTPFQAERLMEGRYRGFVIDEYRVREVLGVGGMGCVYIAEDTRKKRKVALKVLAAKHAIDAGMLARLKLEAEAGMLIRHPNVIRTYAVDSTGAVNYLVMEFMKGISLHELVAIDGPLRWGLACDIFAQIAEGLKASHQKGVLHRDIKPANLLIDHDGKAKLLDFGLARISGSARDEFSLAMIFGHDCLGTPDYISPEQAEDSNSIDETADIYSLGCTMYVALTGRVPFPVKTSRKKIECHRSANPKPITDIRKDVPKEVLQILKKMMSKNPADRFQSAEELIKALKPFRKPREVPFDFRKLITVRARQARDKERQAESERSAITNPRSSITSAGQWVGNSGLELVSEVDTFTGDETPPVRESVPSRPYQQSQEDKVAPVPRNAGRNVPKGWYLKRLKTQNRVTLRRVKTRIGCASECEMKMTGTVCDDRQCTIEYSGDTWQLKQESKQVPTFVQGQAANFSELSHGSKITFSDGSGFLLLNDGAAARQSAARKKWLLLGCVTVLAIAAVGAWLAMK